MMSNKVNSVIRVFPVFSVISVVTFLFGRQADPFHPAYASLIDFAAA
jgi:hypothetical protein